MKSRRVLILGSGKRVRETALPAFARLPREFEIARICARTAKRIEAAGRSFDVSAFAAFTAEDLAAIDLVYVAVGKSAVPEVLARLLELGASRCELLIDTPVLVFKQFRHARALGRFAQAWVAEDCTELPWIAPARAALGELRGASFFHSAYAYHANATLKRLFDARITRARRKNGVREFTFANGLSARVFDPRDYAGGYFVLEGTQSSLSDAPERASGSLPLVPEIESGRCIGLRTAGTLTRFDDDECALLDGPPAAASVTARMESMKRVGFLRLLRRIAAGEGAYPLEEGLDDMLVDYALEKLGRWRATPLTSVRSAPARALFSTISRLAGS